MNNRERILTAIRTALGKSGTAETADPAARANAITPRAPHPRLAFSEPITERWQRLWTARAGTVCELPSRDALPEAVAAWCAEVGAAPPTHASGTLLNLSWPAAWQLRCEPATVTTETAVSEAYAGVAEVGSLVFLSAPVHPITHRFVPDNHLVLLSQSRIVAHFEEFWALLRDELGDDATDWRERLPRTINFVAGPSRTGDVEQTIQLGAHGPRRVHVFLIP
ncbi:LutC/YkgG family protein [Hydrogenophilus thiooxidans]|uniref:LutC/YkgG family protein n=1 Tax=Hydrogenophilus thiooxidans TaxID=2820326 RepID=UPI001C23A633|nr:LUD domain-containing protein [Hydrogenophilus thiooxidans]